MHHLIFDENPAGSLIPLAIYIAGVGLLWWRFDWAVALSAGLLFLAIVLLICDYTRRVVLSTADLMLEKINGRSE